MRDRPKVERQLKTIAQAIDDLTKKHNALSTAAQSSFALAFLCIIENRLGEMLLSTMRHDLSKRFKDDLFENYGPLASLSARIDFCYALRLIDKEMRSDLRIIKEIRNQLSHSPTLRHFNDREMDLIFRKFIQYKVGNDNMTLFGSKIVAVIKKLFDDDEQRKLVLKFLKDAKEWSEP